MNKKTHPRKRMSKSSKLNRIYKLVRDLYDIDPQDLSHVYDMDETPLEEPWSDILVDVVTYPVSEPKYLPTSWLHTPFVESNGAHVWWSSPKKFESRDVFMMPGYKAVKALKNMLKELGTNPKGRVILCTDDGYYPAKLRPTTHAELDHCLDLLEKVSAEMGTDEEREQKKQKHENLVKLVDKVGLDRTLELLTDEAEALKDGEK